MKLGEKLQGLRKMQGWTQEELAAKIAVSRQALSKWESDAALPATENLIQLARLFGVSMDSLVNDDLNCVPEAGKAPVTAQRIHGHSAWLWTALFGGIGLLVMGILNSVCPAIVYDPPEGEVRRIVRTGLIAFLEVHNLEWLFLLCLGLLVAGAAGMIGVQRRRK